MPQIPTFTAQERVVAPVQRGVDPQAFAAPYLRTADAAQKLANTAARFAEDTLQRDQTLRLIQARADLAEGQAQLRLSLRDEQDPANIVPRWQQESAALAQRIGQTLPGAVRGTFVAMAQASAADQLGAVAGLAEGRRVDAGQAALVRGQDALAAEWAEARDPSHRAAIMGNALGQIEAAVGSRFLSREEGERLAIQTRNRFQTIAARQLLDQNPGEALRQLRGGGFAGLSEESRLTLTDRAEASIARAQARAEAAVARRERAIGVEVNAIDNMVLQGFVPEERLAALRQQARGTIYEGRVARLEQDGREVSRWAALPTAQQVERLTALRERLTAGRGSPEDAAQLARLGSVTRAQQQDLNTNGLARAVADGVVPALPTWNAADPAVVGSYVSAAQAASAHYGRPVSAFTGEIARLTVQQFLQQAPEGKLQVLLGVAGIEDPAVRVATLQHIERARGDAGRLPAGALARIADMARTGGFEGQQRATRLLADLTSDVSDRARQQGETTAIRSALEGAQDAGVQGVRVRQAEVTGDARYAATVSRDMDVIQRAAAVRLTSGETSPDRAVQAAQEAWNTGLAVVDDRRLAHVYFPAAEASPAQVTMGLRALRARATEAVDVGPAQDGDAALAARQRAGALRTAVWVNEGSGFSLVSRGAAGAPVVLATATLPEVLAAATGAAANPPPDPARGQQRMIEDNARRRREGERQAIPAPEMR